MEDFSMENDELDHFDSSFKIEKLVKELDNELILDNVKNIQDSFDIELSMVDCYEKGNKEKNGIEDVEEDVMDENVKKIYEYLDCDRNEEETLLKRLKIVEESLDSIINARK